MTVIQILILIFAFFALVKTVWQFKDGALTIAWLLFWSVFWMLAGVVALLPQTTDVIASRVGVGRGADLVTYASLAALFYLIFRLYIKIEHTEREITRLVRTLSLEPFDEE